MKDILIDCFKLKHKFTNEIICEYNIKNKDNIRILNSYEEVVRNNNDFKGKGIENEKEIKDYFEIDNYIMNNESQNNYKNQDICIVQYPYGGNLSFAHGGINSFDNYKIKHLVSTHKGSSGSPNLFQNNFKIIGIHKAGNINNNENIGISMKDILIDCFKNKE